MRACKLFYLPLGSDKQALSFGRRFLVPFRAPLCSYLAHRNAMAIILSVSLSFSIPGRAIDSAVTTENIIFSSFDGALFSASESKRDLMREITLHRLGLGLLSAENRLNIFPGIEIFPLAAPQFCCEHSKKRIPSASAAVFGCKSAAHAADRASECV